MKRDALALANVLTVLKLSTLYSSAHGVCNILHSKLIPKVIHPGIVTCLGGKIQILLYVENYREFKLPIHKHFFHRPPLPFRLQKSQKKTAFLPGISFHFWPFVFR